jgi:hypothetical protein
MSGLRCSLSKYHQTCPPSEMRLRASVRVRNLTQTDMIYTTDRRYVPYRYCMFMVMRMCVSHPAGRCEARFLECYEACEAERV